MSIEAVRAYFARKNMENRIMELEQTTATVADAALAHSVEPGQIAKTLSFKLDETPILIVTAGDAKIANARYKARFGTKAKMLNAEEVLEHTGHAVGGVCPFGLKKTLAVYLDESLRRFTEVIPAAGSHNSSIRLSIAELEKYSAVTEWVDVCRLPEVDINN